MYISRLGKIECVLLLRLWLIALGAADASVMLCMSRSDDICWCMKESSSQTENAPGLCLHQCKDSTIGVVYSLSITDVGPKPASKVLSKAKVEGQLCVLAKQEVLLQGNSISLWNTSLIMIFLLLCFIFVTFFVLPYSFSSGIRWSINYAFSCLNYIHDSESKTIVVPSLFLSTI